MTARLSEKRSVTPASALKGEKAFTRWCVGTRNEMLEGTSRRIRYTHKTPIEAQRKSKTETEREEKSHSVKGKAFADKKGRLRARRRKKGPMKKEEREVNNVLLSCFGGELWN